MKVKDLIEALTAENPEAGVCIAYNYGDYWRTTVAPIIENVDTGYVKYSAYHDMPIIWNGAEVDEVGDKDIENVVILSNMRIY